MAQPCQYSINLCLNIPCPIRDFTIESFSLTSMFISSSTALISEMIESERRFLCNIPFLACRGFAYQAIFGHNAKKSSYFSQFLVQS